MLKLYGALTTIITGTRQAESPFPIGHEDADELLADFYEELSELGLAALRGEMTHEEFEHEAEALVVATFLVIFQQASEQEDTPPEAVLELEEAMAQARLAVRRLANAIFVDDEFAVTEDRTREEAEAKLLNRLILWVATAAGIWALGQLFRPNADEIFYMWQLGNTEQHCSTCLTLSGQVATATDWRFSGFRPQGSMLECGGWRCDCSLVETGADPTGPVFA